MENFLTLKESIEFLTELLNSDRLTKTERSKLASIKICLSGEEQKYDLGGKNVECSRPLFVEGLAYDEDDKEAYQKAVSHALQLVRKES